MWHTVIVRRILLSLHILQNGGQTQEVNVYWILPNHICAYVDWWVFGLVCEKVSFSHPIYYKLKHKNFLLKISFCHVYRYRIFSKRGKIIALKQSCYASQVFMQVQLQNFCILPSRYISSFYLSCCQNSIQVSESIIKWISDEHQK